MSMSVDRNSVTMAIGKPTSVNFQKLTDRKSVV
jgi:hypothetical protein